MFYVPLGLTGYATILIVNYIPGAATFDYDLHSLCNPSINNNTCSLFSQVPGCSHPWIHYGSLQFYGQKKCINILKLYKHTTIQNVRKKKNEYYNMREINKYNRYTDHAIHFQKDKIFVYVYKNEKKKQKKKPNEKKKKKKKEKRRISVN